MVLNNNINSNEIVLTYAEDMRTFSKMLLLTSSQMTIDNISNTVDKINHDPQNLLAWAD